MGLQIPFDLVKPCLGQAVALGASSLVGRNHQVIVDMVFVIVMETSIDHIPGTPLDQVFEGQLSQARFGMVAVHALLNRDRENVVVEDIAVLTFG